MGVGTFRKLKPLVRRANDFSSGLGTFWKGENVKEILLKEGKFSVGCPFSPLELFGFGKK